MILGAIFVLLIGAGYKRYTRYNCLSIPICNTLLKGLTMKYLVYCNFSM